MLKNLILVLGLAAFGAGCTSMSAQSYVMNKERVDIELKEGNNAGYIVGKPVYKEPARKTRKVYVLELTKPVPEEEVQKIEQEVKANPQQSIETAPSGSSSSLGSGYGSDSSEREYRPAAKSIVIPDLDNVQPQSDAVAVKSQGPTETVSYTVIKDDTLQKIAKKFYNSYGKWTKIYQANKEKIKNPNVLRPGTVLTIPVLEEKN